MTYSEALSATARNRVECERCASAMAPSALCGVLGHAAALGFGVEGLGTETSEYFF